MDPNEALKQWRAGKNKRAHAASLRSWVQSGGFEPRWTVEERQEIMWLLPRAKKKTTRVAAKKNPRVHVPKTNRGRPSLKKEYLLEKYNKDGKIVGTSRFNATPLEAKARALSAIKGKVIRTVLDDGRRGK